MNRAHVDRIAEAVLYEGYLLYPYRPSVKNTQRWTFGGLLPKSYCTGHDTGDSSVQQTECLIHGGDDAELDICVRFLHLLSRPTVGTGEPSLPWQEAEERRLELRPTTVGGLTGSPQRQRFIVPGKRQDKHRVCEQQTLTVAVETMALELSTGIHRVTVRVENESPAPACSSRDEAMPFGLASTHVVLSLRAGEFISLTDPPDDCRPWSASCRNIGVWPVLVGVPPERNLMLASPIILSDYPEVAPDSPGDMFDATEIDEILTLRIMTLTDAEKQAMRGLDHRGAALLARTETMAREQLMKLHGVVRPVDERKGAGA